MSRERLLPTAALTTEPNHPGDVLGDAAEVASESGGTL